MSDFEESDTEFDNLRLVSSSPFVANGDSSTSTDERSFEAKFTGSFLEANLFRNLKSGGFGDQTTSDNEENKSKEEFVGLDWDASRIFKNLACPESNNENNVCVLRLHDILSKSEMGIQTMSRQIINCGRVINSQTPENRHDMGFEDSWNVQNLLRLTTSLRANTEVLLLEIKDLEELIDPKLHQKTDEKKKANWMVWISIGAVLSSSLFLAHKYF